MTQEFHCALYKWQYQFFYLDFLGLGSQERIHKEINREIKSYLEVIKKEKREKQIWERTLVSLEKRELSMHISWMWGTPSYPEWKSILLVSSELVLYRFSPQLHPCAAFYIDNRSFLEYHQEYLETFLWSPSGAYHYPLFLVVLLFWRESSTFYGFVVAPMKSCQISVPVSTKWGQLEHFLLH